MLQVCDPHEGLVEVVKLQDAGQQEETRDDDTGEEFGESKRLQADGGKPTDDKREHPITVVPDCASSPTYCTAPGLAAQASGGEETT